MRYRPIKIWLILLFFTLVSLQAGCEQADDNSSLAIISFNYHYIDDQRWQWLSDSLAEMLATNLGQTNKLKIVDFEKVQHHLAEIDHAGTGYINQEKALKFGQAAKVSRVLFGYYQVKGEQLEIHAFIVHVSANRVELVDSVKGSVKDIIDLEKELTLNVAEKLHVPLTEEDVANLKFSSKEFLHALAKYNLGMDAFNQGKYREALRELKLAIKEDANYAEPLLYIGHVYESLGQYENAILAFKKMADTLPENEYADDALFYAAKLIFTHRENPEETIALADRLISDYPDGKLPDSTEIVPARNDYRNRNYWPIGISYHMVYNKTAPFESYMRILKSETYVKLGNYQSALNELALVALLPDPPLRDGRVQYLILDAYENTGLILKSRKGPGNIIHLDLQNPVYEEDYSTDKHLEDTIYRGSHSTPVIKAKRHFYKTINKYALHNVKNSGQVKVLTKGKYFHIYEKYLFAAPKGYVVDAVDLELDAYQESPVASYLSFNAVSQGNTASTLGSRKLGEFLDKRKIAIISGSELFGIRLNIRDKSEGAIYRWKVKAYLSPKRPSGSLTIEGKNYVLLYTMKNGKEVDVAGFYCPCKMPSLTAGSYILKVKNGETRNIVIKAGVEHKIIVDSEDEKEEKIDILDLPRWSGFKKLYDDIRFNHGIGILRTFQDKDGRYWVLWGDKYDIWAISSKDGSKWSERYRLPTSISSQRVEGKFSVMQGEDGKYYLAFTAERANGPGIFVSSSKDMIHWSSPRRIAKLNRLRVGSISLLQDKNGVFRVYFASNDFLLSQVYSKNFRDWSGEERTRMDKSTYLVMQASSGKFWAILGTCHMCALMVDNQLWITSSTDGENWVEPTLIDPSVVATKEYGSRHPTLIENDKGELVLGWHRAWHYAFSKSKDGIKWTSSSAQIGSFNNRGRYEDASFSFMQVEGGEYFMPFSSYRSHFLVAHSADPFK